MKNRKRKKAQSFGDMGFRVRTQILPSPSAGCNRQVIIETKAPIANGSDYIVISRKEHRRRISQLDLLEPLGVGLTKGLLAQPDISKIKIGRKIVYIDLDRRADFRRVRDEVIRIASSQVAYHQ